MAPFLQIIAKARLGVSSSDENQEVKTQVAEQERLLKQQVVNLIKSFFGASDDNSLQRCAFIIDRIFQLENVALDSQRGQQIRALVNSEAGLVELANTYIAALLSSEPTTPAITKVDLKFLAEACRVNIGLITTASDGADYAQVAYQDMSSDDQKYYSILGGYAHAPTINLNLDAGVITPCDPRNDPIISLTEENNVDHYVQLIAFHNMMPGVAYNLQEPVGAGRVITDLRNLTYLIDKIPALKSAIREQADAFAANPRYDYNPSIDLIRQIKNQLLLAPDVVDANKAKAVLNADTFADAVNLLIYNDNEDDDAATVAAKIAYYNQVKKTDVPDATSIDFNNSDNITPNASKNLRKAAFVKFLEKSPTYVEDLIKKHCTSAEIEALKDALANPDNETKQNKKNRILYRIINLDKPNLKFGARGMEENSDDLPLQLSADISKFITADNIQAGITSALEARAHFKLNKHFKAIENSNYSFLAAVVRSLENTPEALQVTKDQLLWRIERTSEAEDEFKTMVHDVLIARSSLIKQLEEKKRDSQREIAETPLDSLCYPEDCDGLRINYVQAVAGELVGNGAAREALLAWDYEKREGAITAAEARIKGLHAEALKNAYEEALGHDPKLKNGDVDLLADMLIERIANQNLLRDVLQLIHTENLDAINLDDLKALYRQALRTNNINLKSVELLYALFPDVNVSIYEHGELRVGDAPLSVATGEPNVNCYHYNPALGYMDIKLYRAPDGSFTALKDDVVTLVEFKKHPELLDDEQYAALESLVYVREGYAFPALADLETLGGLAGDEALTALMTAQTAAGGAATVYNRENAAHRALIAKAKEVYAKYTLNKLKQFADLEEYSAFPQHLEALGYFVDKILDLSAYIESQKSGSLDRRSCLEEDDATYYNADFRLRHVIRTEYLLQTLSLDDLRLVVTTESRDDVKEKFSTLDLAWMNGDNTISPLLGFLNAMDEDEAAQQAFKRVALVRLLETADNVKIKELFLNETLTDDFKFKDSADLRELNAILGDPIRPLVYKQVILAVYLINKYQLGNVADIETLIGALNAKSIEAFSTAITEIHQAFQAIENEKVNFAVRVVKSADPARREASVRKNNILEVLYVAKYLKQPNLEDLNTFKSALITNLTAKIREDVVGAPTADGIRARSRELGVALTEEALSAATTNELVTLYINTIYSKDRADAGRLTSDDMAILSQAMDAEGPLHTHINLVLEGKPASTDPDSDRVSIFSVNKEYNTEDIRNLDPNTSCVDIVRSNDGEFKFVSGLRQNLKLSYAQRERLRAIAAVGNETLVLRGSVPNHNIRNDARAELLFENPEITHDDCLELIKALLAASADNADKLAKIKVIANKASALDKAQRADWDNGGWVASILEINETVADVVVPAELDAMIPAIQKTAVRKYFELNQQAILAKLGLLSVDHLREVLNDLNKTREQRHTGTCNALRQLVFADFATLLTDGANAQAIMDDFIDRNRLLLAGTVQNAINAQAKMATELRSAAIDSSELERTYTRHHLILSAPNRLSGVALPNAGLSEIANVMGLSSVDDLTDEMITVAQNAAASNLLNSRIHHTGLLYQALKGTSERRVTLPELEALMSAIHGSTSEQAIATFLNEHVCGDVSSDNKYQFKSEQITPEIKSLISTWLPGLCDNLRTIDRPTADLSERYESTVQNLLSRLTLEQLRKIKEILYVNDDTKNSDNHFKFNALTRDALLSADCASLQSLSLTDEQKSTVIRLIEDKLYNRITAKLVEGLKKNELDAIQGALTTGAQDFAAVKGRIDALTNALGLQDAEEKLITDQLLLKVVNRNLLTFKELKAELEELCPGSINKSNNQPSDLRAFAKYLYDNAQYNQLPSREAWNDLKNAIKSLDKNAIIKALLALDFRIPPTMVDGIVSSTTTTPSGSGTTPDNFPVPQSYWNDLDSNNVHNPANIADKIILRTNKFNNTKNDYSKIENAALASALKLKNNVEKLDIDAINYCLRRLGPLNKSDELDVLVNALIDSKAIKNHSRDNLLKRLQDSGLGNEIIRSHNLYTVAIPKWLDRKYRELGKKQYKQNQNPSSSQQDKNTLTHDIYFLDQTKNMLEVLRSRKIHFSEQDIETLHALLKKACSNIPSQPRNTEEFISRLNQLMREGGFFTDYNAAPLETSDATRIFSEILSLDEKGVYKVSKNTLSNQNKIMSRAEITTELRVMRKILDENIEPLLANELSQKTYDALKKGVQKSKWESGLFTEVVPSLDKYLAEIQLLKEMPSGHPDAQKRAKELEKFINSYLKDISAKVGNYKKIRESLEKLHKRSEILRIHKTYYQNTPGQSFTKDQQKDLQLIEKNIKKYKDRLEVEAGREEDYKKWKDALEKAKIVLDENLYHTNENGKPDFRKPRKPNEVLENAFRLSAINTALPSKKILEADVKRELAISGVKADSAQVAAGFSVPQNDLDVAEKVGSKYVRLDDMGEYMMVSGDKGSFLHRKGTTHVILTNTKDTTGSLTLNSKEPGGIPAGKISGINKVIMNLRDSHIKRDNAGLYLVNDAGVRLSDYKIEEGEVVPKKFMGNKEPVSKKHYCNYAQLAICAVENIRIPTDLLPIAIVDFNSAKEKVIAAFKSSIEEGDKIDKNNRSNPSFTKDIKEGLELIKHYTDSEPGIDITTALAAKEKLDEHMSARKTLLVASFRAVLREMNLILSNPAMYPFGIKQITLRAEDDIHLQCLLAAVELAKGLFPDKIKNDTFQPDSSATDGHDDDHTTAFMRYQGLVTRGEVPSVKYKDYGGARDCRKNPPYFSYNLAHKESALVRELVEVLGYKPQAPDTFKNEMEKIRTKMNRSAGNSKAYEEADEQYAKFGKEVDNNADPAPGLVEELEIRVKP